MNFQKNQTSDHGQHTLPSETSHHRSRGSVGSAKPWPQASVHEQFRVPARSWVAKSLHKESDCVSALINSVNRPMCSFTNGMLSPVCPLGSEDVQPPFRKSVTLTWDWGWFRDVWGFTCIIYHTKFVLVLDPTILFLRGCRFLIRVCPIFMARYPDIDLSHCWYPLKLGVPPSIPNVDLPTKDH